MNKKMKKIMSVIAVIGLAAVATEPAMAQGLNNITTTLKGQAGGVSDVFSIFAYIAGIGFGIKSALKFKESNESKGQVPISQPIVLAVVSGLLLALPSLLTTNKQVVFGAGSTGTTLDGQSTRSIAN